MLPNSLTDRVTRPMPRGCAIDIPSAGDRLWDSRAEREAGSEARPVEKSLSLRELPRNSEGAWSGSTAPCTAHSLPRQVARGEDPGATRTHLQIAQLATVAPYQNSVIATTPDRYKPPNLLILGRFCASSASGARRFATRPPSRHRRCSALRVRWRKRVARFAFTCE